MIIKGKAEEDLNGLAATVVDDGMPNLASQYIMAYPRTVLQVPTLHRNTENVVKEWDQLRHDVSSIVVWIGKQMEDNKDKEKIARMKKEMVDINKQHADRIREADLQIVNLIEDVSSRQGGSLVPHVVQLSMEEHRYSSTEKKRRLETSDHKSPKQKHKKNKIAFIGESILKGLAEDAGLDITGWKKGWVTRIRRGGITKDISKLVT